MKTRVSLVILLLLTFVLIGCAPQGLPVPSDPLEAVKTIADKQKEVKTQHTDLTLNLSLKLNGLSSGDNQQSTQALAMLKNFKANATLSGDADNVKNDFTFNGSADLGPFTALLANGEDKLTFQLVKVGDKLYTKAAGDTQWNQQDATTQQSTGKTDNNPISPDQVMALLQKATKAEKLADEKIGDTDTYHYKVTLNPVDLITSIADMAKSNGANVNIDQAQLDEAKNVLKNSVFEVELWAGKQDLYLRQFNFHMNLNLTDIPNQPGASALVDLAVNSQASKLNQPVTITAPQ